MKPYSILLLALVARSGMGADPACVPGVSGVLTGATVICDIATDTTNPSKQILNRKVTIAYPTSMGASNAAAPIVVEGTGKAWRVANWTPYGRITAMLPNIQNLINSGFVVYGFYDTMAGAYQTTASITAGAATPSVTITNLNLGGANTLNDWWPNMPDCVTIYPVNTCAYSYPYTIMVDGNTANQEQATVTGTSGSGQTFSISVTWTCAGKPCFSHSAGTILDVPVTQWPAQLNDRMAVYSWIKSHAGKNDTACNGGPCPGNPNDIRLTQGSSDSHVGLMSAYTPQGSFLSNCPGTAFWYGSSLGPVCGSDNNATGWSVTRVTGWGAITDLPYLYSNGDGIIQSGIRALLGCKPGIDTGCTAFAAAASPYSIADKSRLSEVYLQCGSVDTTAPCGNLSSFQTSLNYGTVYQIFAGYDHPCGANCWPPQLRWLQNLSGNSFPPGFPGK